MSQSIGVPVGTSSTQLLAANQQRVRAEIVNDSANGWEQRMRNRDIGDYT